MYLISLFDSVIPDSSLYENSLLSSFIPHFTKYETVFLANIGATYFNFSAPSDIIETEVLLTVQS